LRLILKNFDTDLRLFVLAYVPSGVHRTSRKMYLVSAYTYAYSHRGARACRARRQIGAEIWAPYRPLYRSTWALNCDPSLLISALYRDAAIDKGLFPRLYACWSRCMVKGKLRVPAHSLGWQTWLRWRSWIYPRHRSPYICADVEGHAPSVRHVSALKTSKHVCVLGLCESDSKCSVAKSACTCEVKQNWQSSATKLNEEKKIIEKLAWHMLQMTWKCILHKKRFMF